MQRKFILKKSNWITKVFAILFPSIILTGCPAMYGSPYASYTTSGCVTNEKGRPLQGIKISSGGYFYTDSLGQEQIHFDGSAITDVRGEYLIDLSHSHLVEMIVVAEDIDGERGGGEYQSDTLVIKDFKYKGGKGWYSGHAKIKDANFRLKKK